MSPSLPAPPRRVVGGPSFSTWAGRAIILPHLTVVVLSLFFLVLDVSWRLFGTNQDATVVSGLQRQVKRGVESVLAVTLPGRGDVREWVPVSPALYARHVDGAGALVSQAPLRVRAFGVAPFRRVALESDSWNTTVMLGLFWLVMSAVLAVPVYFLWVLPLRRKRLVRSGVETLGTVLSTNERVPGGNVRWAVVEFNDRQGLRHEVRLRAPDRRSWAAMAQGQRVTMLYDEAKPSAAVALQLCEYGIA